MAYLIVCVVALLASALTLFTGFGLGSLLMPAFALFFAVEVAVAATAVVHLASNIFKAFLIGWKADLRAVLRFGVPAAACAVAGALVLDSLIDVEPLVAYRIGPRVCKVTPVKLVIGLLIVSTAVFQLIPRFQEVTVPRRWVPLGGAISGFLGGLSGHQGAPRSAFLIRIGLEKEAFIGTVTVCAIIVDATRLTVYGLTFFAEDFRTLVEKGQAELILVGIVAALFGAVVGVALLKKMKMAAIKYIVGVLLLLMGLALSAGII